MAMKLDFLNGVVAALKDIPSDVQLKPAGNGPSVPAHRALLAIRSEKFRNMLESDEYTTPPTNTTITLPEFTYEELEAFVEFLYTGDLDWDKVDRYAIPLLKAADKYEIPYLQEFCNSTLIETMYSSNALRILESSYICSNKSVKDAAMKCILKGRENIIFQSEYEEFAKRNPDVSVEITRTLLSKIRSLKNMRNY